MPLCDTSAPNWKLRYMPRRERTRALWSIRNGGYSGNCCAGRTTNSSMFTWIGSDTA